MAERLGDNRDLILDEMKRKARRRLVGAIVLALAAAIILPMLLEKDPRPLGDEVSVQIPPVDDGKFVNRLTAKADASKATPKADDKAQPKATVGKSEATKFDLPKSDASRAEASTSEAAPTSAPPADAASPQATSVEEPQQRKEVTASAEPSSAPPAKAPASGETKPEPAPKAETVAKAAPPEVRPPPSEVKDTAAPKASGFVVQLAAFADDKGANALANKLKKAGYAAYVEPVQTSRGTLWRVRVGGYPSRPDADAGRAKLKGEGYNGIVAPVS
jgi:DedD protein